MVENYSEETVEKGGEFWLNQLNHKWSDITWGMVEDEEPNTYGG